MNSLSSSPQFCFSVQQSLLNHRPIVAKIPPINSTPCSLRHHLSIRHRCSAHRASVSPLPSHRPQGRAAALVRIPPVLLHWMCSHNLIVLVAASEDPMALISPRRALSTKHALSSFDLGESISPYLLFRMSNLRNIFEKKVNTQSEPLAHNQFKITIGGVTIEKEKASGNKHTVFIRCSAPPFLTVDSHSALCLDLSLEHHFLSKDQWRAVGAYLLASPTPLLRVGFFPSIGPPPITSLLLAPPSP